MPQRTAGQCLASFPACASLSRSSVRASLACTRVLVRPPSAGLVLDVCSTCAACGSAVDKPCPRHDHSTARSLAMTFDDYQACLNALFAADRQLNLVQAQFAASDAAGATLDAFQLLR